MIVVGTRWFECCACDALDGDGKSSSEMVDSQETTHADSRDAEICAPSISASPICADQLRTQLETALPHSLKQAFPDLIGR